MVEMEQEVCAIEFDGFWSDVGRPEELDRINRLAAEGSSTWLTARPTPRSRSRRRSLRISCGV